MSFVKDIFQTPKAQKLNPIIIQQAAAPQTAPEAATPAAAPAQATQASAGISMGGITKAFGRGSLIANGIAGGLTKKAQGLKKSLIGGM